MTTTTTAPSFAHGPIASDSAQFPLGAPFDRTSHDEPSSAAVRPWSLRGMQQQPDVTERPRKTFRFDHQTQMTVDTEGRPLIEAGDPTVKNKTNNDGDEGPSEDFSYDFVPDEPFQV